MGRASALIGAAALIITAIPALAADTSFAVGELKVVEPWARETIASARAGGSFMTIINSSDQPDRLISAYSEQASRIELHHHVLDGDVARMREIEGGIDIAAEGTTALEPGGVHVMLIGLNGQLVEGESFPMTLEFEKAGQVTIEVAVKDIRHQGHGGHGHGGGHNSGGHNSSGHSAGHEGHGSAHDAGHEGHDHEGHDHGGHSD